MISFFLAVIEFINVCNLFECYISEAFCCVAQDHEI